MEKPSSLLKAAKEFLYKTVALLLTGITFANASVISYSCNDLPYPTDSALTSYHLNQQNANDNHERRAAAGGYAPSGLETMGQISYHRNGLETHLALVDVEGELLKENGERLGQLTYSLHQLFETEDEDLKEGLEALLHTEAVLTASGMDEDERATVLLDEDISSALQVSAALQNAQQEKIHHVQNIKSKGKSQLAASEEKVLLSIEEVKEVSGHLTLTHLYPEGEEGYGITTRPLAEEETTAAREALLTLSRGQQALDRLIEAHPEQAQALQKVAMRVGKAIDLMGFVTAGAQGAMQGMVAGSAGGTAGVLIGGLGGAALGMYTYHKIGEALSTVMEAGSEQVGHLAATQGRTLKESLQFDNAVQNLFLAGTLMYGAKGIRPPSLGRNLDGVMEPKGKGRAVDVDKQLAPDYSTPEVAYSLRIDPLTGKGPMSVDSNKFTSAKSYTAEGAKRNKDQFWKMWAEKYPETLSEKNLKIINSGIAPKVDGQWLQHFPEHQSYAGRTLVHHHIEHGNLTTALPDKLHNRKPGNKYFHTHLGGGKKND